jgi:hypothetical protein
MFWVVEVMIAKLANADGTANKPASTPKEIKEKNLFFNLLIPPFTAISRFKLYGRVT